MKKIVVDKNKCIGCGTCVALCPEVFELGEEGKAKVILNIKYQISNIKLEEAIEACPVGAINWQ